MSRRDTRDDLVQAALVFVDTHGVDALTLRSLGAEVGLHHTALYRHFRSKSDLLDSVISLMLTEAIVSVQPLSEDPRVRLESLALAWRSMFRSHPGLAMAVVSGAGTLPQATEIQILVVSAVRELGVAEDMLARVCQALESYVAGSTLFDFSGAPQHLEQRRLRYRACGDSALDAVSATEADIDANNEAAFRWGLKAVLDGAVAQGPDAVPGA